MRATRVGFGGTGRSLRRASESKPAPKPFGPNAEWVLDAALSKAKLEDKRVLVCLGGPGCEMCRVLEQFLKSNDRLFKGEYVIAKIDRSGMEMGEAVATRLRKGREDGDPWMVILDADGARQIDSQVIFLRDSALPSELYGESL